MTKKVRVRFTCIMIKHIMNLRGIHLYKNIRMRLLTRAILNWKDASKMKEIWGLLN